MKGKLNMDLTTRANSRQSRSTVGLGDPLEAQRRQYLRHPAYSSKKVDQLHLLFKSPSTFFFILGRTASLPEG